MISSGNKNNVLFCVKNSTTFMIHLPQAPFDYEPN